MLPTVPIAMFGFIPFVLWLFSRLPPRRAALSGFLLGWMFLPDYTYSFSGLPNYDKTLAASLSVLLGAWIFDRKTFRQFRFQLPDAVMIFWFLTPMFASVANGLGLYDGFSAMKNYVTTWGAPYLIGRLYFTDGEAVQDLLWGLFLGALAYVPLCWIEMIVSPQLHRWVYGYHAHEFLQSVRAIGYRPTVFMHHGLMIGMWMASGCLAGLILWRWDGRTEQVFGYSLKMLVIALLVTTVACQSIGALILLSVGYACLCLCRKTNSRVAFLLLALFPVLFLSMKVTQKWTGQGIVEIAQKISEERAASFEFRVINEERLVKKALEQPMLGWGGWGRSRVYDDAGNDITVTDSYWIIIFGQTGIVGLTAFSLILLIPIFRFLRKHSIAHWALPGIAHAAPLAMLLVIYFFDCLVNDMKTPVYTLVMGTLANGYYATVKSTNSPESPKFPRVLA